MQSLSRRISSAVCVLLLHASLLCLGLAAPAAAPVPNDSDIFEKLEKDPIAETSETAEPTVPLPPAASEVVTKLKQFEQQSSQELAKTILDRRKILVTKLQAMAAKASPELRAEIEGKISRMEAVAWNTRVAHPGWSPNPTLDRLMGEWFLPNGRHYILERDGKIMSDGKQTGVWSWVDSELGIVMADTYGNDLVDLIRLVPDTKDQAEAISNHGETVKITRKYDSNIDGNHYRYPLAQAAYFEEKLHQAHKGNLIKQQHDTAAKLRALTKSLDAPIAAAINTLADKIAGGKHGQRDKAERVKGRWKGADGVIWDFRSDGQLYRNDKRIEGRWIWAKVGNWNTILVRTTTGELGSDKALEVFFARVSGKDPNLLRVIGLEKPAGELLRQ